MKLESRACEAGRLLKGLEGPAEGFPLNSEYTGFQKGGDVLLFKQQNRISCESPTCNAGERENSCGAGGPWPRGNPGSRA